MHAFRSSILAATLLIATAASPSFADVVASWGGNYLSGNNQTAAYVGVAAMANLTRDGVGTNNDNGFGVAFQSPTSGTSIAPTTLSYPTANAGSGYVAGPSLYGGFEFIAFNTTAPTQEARNGVTDSNGANAALDPDLFTFRGRFGTGDNATAKNGQAAGVILLATASPTSLGANSTFDLTVTAADGSLTGRMVVQNNGSFYISSDTFAYSIGAKQLLVTAGTQFYAYDPATSINFNQASPGVPVAASFANVTAVGFYFENDQIQTSSFTNHFNSDANLEISSFSVNASPIPEPASMVLIGAGLSLLLLRRRTTR